MKKLVYLMALTREKKYNVIKHCEWLVEICLENDV